MTLEDNIRTYLTQRKFSAWVDDEKKRQYINVICAYYGFGSLTLPTLDDVAIACNVGRVNTKNRRARPLQIKQEFLDEVSLHDLPVLKEICNVLDQKDLHRVDELEAVLVRRGLVSSPVSSGDIIRLLNEVVGGKSGYAIFNSDLVEIKKFRSADVRVDRAFVVVATAIDGLKGHLRKARTRTGIPGMAKLESLQKDLCAQDRQLDWELFLNLLTSHEGYREVEVYGEIWYAFDDKESSIINMAAKLFSQDDCKRLLVEDLAALLANAVRGRVGKKAPPAKAIEKYLRASGRFHVANDQVVYNGPTQEPTPIERDVIMYLRELGIYLTQVATRCSMRACGGLPARFGGV